MKIEAHGINTSNASTTSEHRIPNIEHPKCHSSNFMKLNMYNMLKDALLLIGQVSPTKTKTKKKKRKKALKCQLGPAIFFWDLYSLFSV